MLLDRVCVADINAKMKADAELVKELLGKPTPWETSNALLEIPEQLANTKAKLPDFFATHGQPVNPLAPAKSSNGAGSSAGHKPGKHGADLSVKDDKYSVKNTTTLSDGEARGTVTVRRPRSLSPQRSRPSVDEINDKVHAITALSLVDREMILLMGSGKARPEDYFVGKN